MSQAESIAEQEQLTEEPGLDAEARARREAALRHVRKIGDPVLRATALPVEHFDKQLIEEIARMGALMRDSQGVGLAATQVGVLHRLFVYSIDIDEPVRALVNPLIEALGAERECAEEGCLSIPAIHVEVERFARVRVRAQDERGRPLDFQAEGLEARVIQHELDHLDGVLILDHIDREQRRAAMRALREGRPYSPQHAED